MNEIQVVQDWYRALQSGDVPALLGAFSPDIEWRQAEGHPYQPGGEPWVGPDAVRDNLFVRLMAEWENFVVDVRAVYDAGATVVSEGRYTGTFKATVKNLDSHFCHVWQVKDGKLATFHQYMNTAQLRAVTGFEGTEGDPLAGRMEKVAGESGPHFW